MSQDFSKKMTIVLREGLASWQLTNTVGHIAAYLGNKMPDSFDTGDYFVSKDDQNFPRNSQYAVVALSASNEALKNLALELRGSELLWIVYVQDMIDMIDDAELEGVLRTKSAEEMDILGIGIFGLKDELKKITGKFKLWK